jgi:uncharacterized protein (TIGR00369 family)
VTVDVVRAAVTARSPTGLASLLGMETELVDHGRVVFTFPASPRFANPFGTVHGGILATVLDSAMGMAALTAVPDGVSTTTLSLELKYLRPVATDAGLLRAEGAVVHAGRRVVTAEGRLVGPDDRLFVTATTMPDHRYQQYCALARALDVAGDRWTLLIVRELVPGPRRFTDLVDGLPGVSRKLLTERLRDLERDGIVTRQELPPPAARQVYDLTDDGRDLAVAIGPLLAWGTRRMTDREPADSFHPRWAAVAMSVLADRDAARGVRETYQFVIDRTAFHAVVDDGAVHVRDGFADDPAVTWTTDEETWSQIASGTRTAAAALEAGTLTIEGERKAASRLSRIFSRRQMLARATERLPGR